MRRGPAFALKRGSLFALRRRPEGRLERALKAVGRSPECEKYIPQRNYGIIVVNLKIRR